MITLELPRIEEMSACGELPTPTALALRILDLTRRDTTSIADLAGVIKVDPALTGKLLKYANSVRGGSLRPIVAVEDAVIRLGFRTVGQIALGFSLISQYRQGACTAFDYDRYWSRSLAIAVGTQTVARGQKVIAPGEGFTCGLLSGVGRLALATVHPDAYSRVLEECAEGPIEAQLHRETDRFGISHDQFSAALLRDWGLPEVCVHAVYAQKDPDTLKSGSRERQLAEYLHFASLIATRCIEGDALRDDDGLEVVEAARAAGVDPERFAGFYDAIVTEWRELGAMLELPSEVTPSIEEISERIQESCFKLEQRREKTARTVGGPLRVLVIDDDPATVRMVSSCLMKEKHEVLTAGDGIEGLHLTLSAHPHVVITDWLMPAMDGVEYCMALRRAESTRRVYVILLTGNEKEAHLVEAFAAGADDYILKPVNPQVLLARLSAAERIIDLQTGIDRDREELRAYAAQLGVVNRKLGRVAFMDPLTLLANRRSGMLKLSQAWQRAVETGRPLSCLMVDIDHFKLVNDCHGHDAGDRVLRKTAEILRTAARQGDIACRFGGEEFVLVCPDTEIEGAMELAERLRTAVAEQTVQGPNYACSVKLSIGVATRTAGMENPEALLRAADSALYAAKAAGRNTVMAAVREKGIAGSPSSR